MIEHDRAAKVDVTNLLREVHRYYPHARIIGARNARGIDADAVRGLDDAADAMAHRSEYRHLFHGHEGADAGNRLFDLLAAGRPQAMSEDEAYEAALGHLLGGKEAGFETPPSGVNAAGEGGPIPHARQGRPDDELSVGQLQVALEYMRARRGRTWEEFRRYARARA
jgi:hypothetical protein